MEELRLKNVFVPMGYPLFIKPTLEEALEANRETQMSLVGSFKLQAINALGDLT